MIRKKADRMVKTMEEFRGGKLTTEISGFLTEEEVHGTGRGFSVNTLPPGGSIGWHQHTGDFEVYLVLQGTARVEENDRSEHILDEGDMMFCEDGAYHSIENVGGDDLKFLSLILYTPQK